MGSFKISVNGLDAAINKIELKAANLKPKVNKALWEFGFDVQADAKRLAPGDEGKVRNSIDLIKEDLAVEVVCNSIYAAYMEFGTGKYAADYVSTLPSDWQTYALQFKGHSGGTFDEMIKALYEWIVRKGIKPEPKQGVQEDSFLHGKLKNDSKPKKKQTLEEQQKQLAYVFAISIMINGVKAQPFLYPAFLKHKQNLIDRIKAIINE